MNIEELALQCWEARSYGPSWFDYRKFAKLIVKEQDTQQTSCALGCGINCLIDSAKCSQECLTEQQAAQPTHTSSPQVGPPGHCTLAQVWDADGNSLATFDSTKNPDVASSRARLLADALNAAAQTQQAADKIGGVA